jgi:hypothetical protein
LRLLALTAWLGAGMAHASDYVEISQLLKTGKAAEALGKADQRLTAAPRDPQLRFLRGVAQTDIGQTDAAMPPSPSSSRNTPSCRALQQQR